MYCRNETGQDLEYRDDSVEMYILAYYGVGTCSTESIEVDSFKVQRFCNWP